LGKVSESMQGHDMSFPYIDSAGTSIKKKDPLRSPF